MAGHDPTHGGTTTHDTDGLRSFLTLREPLGPPHSDKLVEASAATFRHLYDSNNGVSDHARREDPSYVVGRKGAGKTAFLVGSALDANAEVVMIKSHDVYGEVNALRLALQESRGPLPADHLAHVWETLLTHAALYGIASSTRLPGTHDRQRIWDYVAGYSPPSTGVEGLLASVSTELTRALLDPSSATSIPERCRAVSNERGTYLDAVALGRRVLAGPRAQSIRVVVDNLEDLHRHLESYAEVVAGLFRFVGDAVTASSGAALPFPARFAFPAELMPRLVDLSANPEKDFRDYLVIHWSASELMGVVGNRVHAFLLLHSPQTLDALELSYEHDPTDREAATAVLRAFLPGRVRNGYGTEEDTIAYLLRHTQLLPRHLIELMNSVIRQALLRARPGLPLEVTPRDVIDGVHLAEDKIVNGILSAYQNSYPYLRLAIDEIKNRIDMVGSVTRLHTAFNVAGVRKRFGVKFTEFVRGCTDAGIIGLVDEQARTGFYVQGDFSYTFRHDLRLVEDVDTYCVHPLFMYRLFDRPARSAGPHGNRAVYPYGTDPSHPVGI